LAITEKEKVQKTIAQQKKNHYRNKKVSIAGLKVKEHCQQAFGKVRARESLTF
jgi:hypothetical protein